MENLFVPYEIALALKKLGFNEKCLVNFFQGKFNNEKNTLLLTDERTNADVNSIDFVSCPLYQQVIEWLMLKHHIKIWWIPVFFNDDRLMIKAIKDDKPETVFYNEFHDTNKLNEGYNEAIIEALKHI